MLEPVVYGLNPFALPPFAIACAAFLLTLMVIVRERGTSLNYLFALLAVPLIIWPAAFAMMYCAITADVAYRWARIAYVGVPLIPAALYHFTAALIQTDRRLRRRIAWRWALGIGFVAAALTTDWLLAGVQRYWWGFYPRYGWLGLPYLAFFVVTVGESLWHLWQGGRASVAGSVQRHRLRMLCIATLIGSLASIDFLAKYGVACYPAGYVAVLVFLVMATHLIWRYHLTDWLPSFAANHILDTMYGAMIVTDLDGRIRISNRIAHALLGTTGSQLLGKTLAEVTGTVIGHDDDIRRLLHGGAWRDREMSWRTAAGRTVEVSISASTVTDVNHHPVGVVYVALDISRRKRAEEALRQAHGELEQRVAARTAELKTVAEQLERANSDLERLALIDPLTEVLNRRGLQRALSREIEWSRREGIALLGMLVDLDDFKQINDTLGHVVGDGVLKEVVRKVQRSLRVTDHVARVGGDEFIVLLPRTRLGEGVQVAEKVRLAISGMPIPIAAGRTVKVTASFGLVTVGQSTPAIDELLAQTNAVLHRSKEAGKNRVMCDRADLTGGSARADILQVLREGHLFQAVMQPIVRLDDRSCIAYELLSRLPAIEGFQMPDDFFRVALEANLLTLVDHKCLSACVAAAHMLDGALRQHVNLFPSTLLNIPVAHLLETFPADRTPGHYCIEISEQQIIGEPSYLAEPVAALKEAGFLIAIDDVGFGRSSLESLVLLEPNIVKIDKRCVFGIAQDPVRVRSFQRLLKVARVLGTDVIAEGVEVPEDSLVLQHLGVHYGQGYLFGRPVPIRRELAEATAPVLAITKHP